MSTSIARNSAEIFIAGVLKFGFAALTGVLIARWLGPEGKGAYGSVQLAAGFVSVVAGGAGTAVSYLLTRKRQPLGDLLPALGVLWFVLTLIVWLALAVWGSAHGISASAWVFGVAVPATVVLSWQQGLYVGLGRLRNLNRQVVGLAAATCAGVAVALGPLRGALAQALAAWTVCLGAAALVVVVHAVRLGPGPARAPVAGTLGSVVRYGAQAALNNLLGFLSYRVDSLLLLSLLGTATFGVYTVAVTLGEQLLMMSRPVTTAVAREIGAQDLATSGAIAARVIRLCAAAVCVAAAVMFVVGPLLIELLYGAQFESAALSLRLFLPGVVVYSSASTFASFFLLQLGRPWIVASINVAMIACQTVACLLLIPKLGASGAALASTATYALGASLNTWRFCRVTGLPVAEVWLVRPSDIRRVWAAWPVLRVGSPKA